MTPTDKGGNQTVIGRRSFLTKLWVGLGLVVVAEIVAVVFAFLRPRHPQAKGDDAGGMLEAGHVEGFRPNSVTAFVRGKFYLCRLENGGFLAVSRRCTHLGCTVPWVEEKGKFECPCHASSFDIRGDVVTPPAPRPLDLFPVVIENELVKVDIRKPMRRTAFREEQVVHPRKSVTHA
jgi:cytochrome b6-f complex iron-sulfur subunit